MPLPRGHTLPFSRGRRLVGDFLHFSRSVPQVTVERVAHIPDVAAARADTDPNPGWYPILLKAFARAAVRVPDLRRSYLTVPHARLYEHGCSVAAVTVEREVDGEPVVLLYNLRQPEVLPLPVIAAKLRWAKTAPVWDVPDFRRVLRMSRLPRPARRLGLWLGLRVSGRWRQRFWGTFTATSVAPAGGALLSPLCPLTTVFTVGPVGADGAVLLRLGFDHRVLDGMAAARGLAETEAALRGELLAELRALARRRRAV